MCPQVKWEIKEHMTLIDLPNDFYIVKFNNKVDCNLALYNGSWMIAERYLHIQCWRPNFMTESAQIDLLPLRVHFPILLVKYYIVSWLQKAGNMIRRTLKVDNTTLSASRGKFAHACVEVEMRKPLKSYYKLWNKEWRLQYEGLLTLCFICGRYGHNKDNCSENPNYN